MSEFFDIFDEALNHIGVKPREEVHRDGDWHQVFHCWVIGREASGGNYVILQQRALNKDYPGKIDISAAGHLEAGESVKEGVREIEEELGLRVNYDDLVPLGMRIGIMKVGDMIDNQICHVFLYECDQALESYRFPTDEIIGLLKLRIDDGIRLFAGEVESAKAVAVGLDAREIVLTIEDFISSMDNYKLKVFILAQRYFAGEKHLLI